MTSLRSRSKVLAMCGLASVVFVGLGCTVHISTAASGSADNAPGEDARAPSADDDTEENANTSPAPADESQPATPDAVPGDAQPVPPATTGGQDVNAVMNALVAAIKASDAAALRALVDANMGLIVDGTKMGPRSINDDLMGTLAAYAQGGPAPRVEQRCESPEDRKTRTCSLFQHGATWTVILTRDDAGTLHVTSLTRNEDTSQDASGRRAPR